MLRWPKFYLSDNTGVACFCQNSTDVILTKHKQGVELLTSLNFLYHKECGCLLLLAGRKCQAGVCWGHWGGVWRGDFSYYIHIFTTFAILEMAKNIEEYEEVIFYVCEIDLFWLSSSLQSLQLQKKTRCMRGGDFVTICEIDLFWFPQSLQSARWGKTITTTWGRKSTSVLKRRDSFIFR